MSTVQLVNVNKIYPDGTEAVHSFSMTVENQELMILAGPSGCGKTTVLRMIAGLEDVTSGDILIDKKKVNEVSARKRNVSMVFQNYALYPHMTVAENMSFGLKMRKVPREEIASRIQDVAHLLDISDILNRKPGVLSGGQQQRVALGRAIVRRPNIFLFDEPLSNLDAHSRAKMRTELSRLHTRLATTMIYVTHDQLEAMTMGEKIVLMNNGRIQQIGDPITIYEKPANRFVAGFFGNPPINFFSGMLETDGTVLLFKTAVFSLAVAQHANTSKLLEYKNKPVIMGIRPEHIYNAPNYVENPLSVEVKAFADVIEPMGPETLVYVTSGEHDYVVRFESHNRVQVGQSLKLYFDMSKSLFFDSETENLI